MHIALIAQTGEAVGRGGLPIGDWQFWVATLFALLAGLWLTRKVVPWRRILRRPPRPRGRRATLTLDGVAIEKRKRRGGGGSCCH